MITNKKYPNLIILGSGHQPETIERYETIASIPYNKDEKVVGMIDSHIAGKTAVGCTLTVNNGKICPDIISSDIGCGVITYKTNIKKTDNIDWEQFDKHLRDTIPTGNLSHSIESYEKVKLNKVYEIYETMEKELSNLKHKIDISTVMRSLGTLGGGNHFIEINYDENDSLWLTVHSGSRGAGGAIGNHYSKLAKSNLTKLNSTKSEEFAKLLAKVDPKERQSFIKEHKDNKKIDPLVKTYPYLDGNDAKNYIHDLKIGQVFAQTNRQIMILLMGEFIEKVSGIEVKFGESIESMHNYYDHKQKIIRKGAINATKGLDVVIPFNMRDGILIGKGISGEEFNYSAPHGSGRNKSRTEFLKNYGLEDMINSMKGVKSWSLNKNSLDEAPAAYKSTEKILSEINNVVDVKFVLKPFYNFKDCSDKIIYGKKK